MLTYIHTQTLPIPHTTTHHDSLTPKYPKMPHPTPPSRSNSRHLACKAKHLLLRSIRPTPANRNNTLLRASDLCQHKCIYCDIWKLALLVYSRAPSTTTPTNSPATSPSTSRFNTLVTPNFSQTGAPRTTEEYEYERSLKAIEAGHHQQRTHLSSILSICTVSGAEESEGLRVAHDRCLSAVLDLIRQERALNRQWEQREKERMQREREVRDWAQRQWEMESRERDWGCVYGYRRGSNSYGYGAESRRGSVVSCAM
jgi:hypothetical protein